MLNGICLWIDVTKIFVSRCVFRFMCIRMKKSTNAATPLARHKNKTNQRLTEVLVHTTLIVAQILRISLQTGTQ